MAETVGTQLPGCMNNYPGGKTETREKRLLAKTVLEDTINGARIRSEYYCVALQHSQAFPVQDHTDRIEAGNGAYRCIDPKHTFLLISLFRSCTQSNGSKARITPTSATLAKILAFF